MESFLEEIDLIHQVSYLLNGETRLTQNKIIAHRKYKWEAYEYFTSEVSCAKGIVEENMGLWFCLGWLQMEVNYKQCLYKYDLKEKQGKNFTFGNGVCLKKEMRKLEVEAVN